MIIRLVVLIIIALLPVKALAQNVLSSTAASLQPGQYAIITNATQPSGSHFRNPVTYTDSMAWDSISHKFAYCGEDEGQHFYEVPIYDAATNAFHRGPAQPGVPFNNTWACAHQYDNTTIDTNTGNMYFRMGPGYQSLIQNDANPGVYQSLWRFNVASEIWTAMPAQNVISESTSCCQALAFFKERNSIVVVASDGQLIEFRIAQNNWAVISTTPPANWNQSSFAFAEYSPQFQAIFFGTSDRMWKLASNGTVTRVADPPAPLYGVGFGGNVTADPATGQLVAYVPETSLAGYPNYNFAAYNPASNTWTAVQTNILPKFAYPLALGAITSAPVPEYGVIVTHICGIFSGDCGDPNTGQSRILVYKHASSGAPDVTPPTAPTNLTANVLSSTQVSLTWTVSTDASGISNYRIERCAGTCTSGGTWAQIGTSPNNNFGDTGLTATTTYSWRVRAQDASANGNLGPYSNIVTATTTTGGTVTPDQDFANRCKAAGVTACWNFDVAGNLRVNGGAAPTNPVDTSPQIVRYSTDNAFGTVRSAQPDTVNGFYGCNLDTTTKTSGAGSLKCLVPAGTLNGDGVGAFSPGGVTQANTPGLGRRFLPGETFYVQTRIRFSTNFFSAGHDFWGDASKIFMLHETFQSCGGLEITTNSQPTVQNNKGLANIYIGCGANNLFTNSDMATMNNRNNNIANNTGTSLTPPWYRHQGAYACADSSNPGFTGFVDGLGQCLFWPVDTWITLYYKVTNPGGSWPNGNNINDQSAVTSKGSIEAWYALPGGNYIKWINITGASLTPSSPNTTAQQWLLWSCNSNYPCPTEGFDNFTLPGIHPNQMVAAAPYDVWVNYDELIASTQPIAAPGLTTPGDTTPPTIVITSPAPPSAGTATTPITVQGTAADNVGVTSVTWTCPTCTPNGGTAAGTTAWSVSNLGLASGSNSFTAISHDAAGNPSSPASLNVLLGFIVITSPTANPTYSTTQSTVTLGGTSGLP